MSKLKLTARRYEIMKTLKLQQNDNRPRQPQRRSNGARALPGETPALPLCLIDTQTLHTLKVEVDAKQIAAVPPLENLPAAAPALSLSILEAEQGYDPYNNFGESAARRRPRPSTLGSHH